MAIRPVAACSSALLLASALAAPAPLHAHARAGNVVALVGAAGEPFSRLVRGGR